MTFTNEMIEKAKKATSAEELLELAKEEGVELSSEEAEQYYSFLNSRELTEEELQMVAGGKGGPKPKPTPNPKYKIGQTVERSYPSTNTVLKGTITGIGWYSQDLSWWYRVHYYQRTHYHPRKGPITTPFSDDDWEYAEMNSDVKVY